MKKRKKNRVDSAIKKSSGEYGSIVLRCYFYEKIPMYKLLANLINWINKKTALLSGFLFGLGDRN